MTDSETSGLVKRLMADVLRALFVALIGITTIATVIVLATVVDLVAVSQKVVELANPWMPIVVWWFRLCGSAAGSVLSALGEARRVYFALTHAEATALVVFAERVVPPEYVSACPVCDDIAYVTRSMLCVALLRRIWSSRGNCVLERWVYRFLRCVLLALSWYLMPSLLALSADSRTWVRVTNLLAWSVAVFSPLVVMYTTRSFLAQTGESLLTPWLEYLLEPEQVDVEVSACATGPMISVGNPRRDAHAVHNGVPWIESKHSPKELSPVFGLFIKSPDGVLLFHSSVIVGSDMLVGCAHAFCDHSLSVVSHAARGYQVLLLKYGSQVTENSRFIKVPAKTIDLWTDSSNICTFWRGRRDNATSRDWCAVRFPNAGSICGAAAQARTFATTQEETVKLYCYRPNDAANGFDFRHALTSMEGRDEAGVYSSSVGSEPGMSGCVVLADDGGIAALNLGYDHHTQSGLLLGCATIRAGLTYHGFFYGRSRVLTWNHDWRKTKLSCIVTLDDIPTYEIPSVEAHAGRAVRMHHRFVRNEHATSGESYGGKKQQSVARDWIEQAEEAQVTAEIEREIGNRMHDGEALESRAQAESYARKVFNSKANRKGHGLEEQATEDESKGEVVSDTEAHANHVSSTFVVSFQPLYRQAAPDGLRYDSGKLVKRPPGLGEPDGPPLANREFNKKHGVDHYHECEACKCTYKHKHGLPAGGSKVHGQWEGQCPNPNCAQFSREDSQRVWSVLTAIDGQEVRGRAPHGRKAEASLPDVEGLTVSTALKTLERRPRSSKSLFDLQLKTSYEARVAEKIKEVVKLTNDREAHSLPVFENVATRSEDRKAMDLTHCVCCGAKSAKMSPDGTISAGKGKKLNSESYCGWCENCITRVQVRDVGKQGMPADDFEKFKTALHAKYPALADRVARSKPVYNAPMDIEETKGQDGLCLYRSFATTSFENVPRAEKSKAMTAQQEEAWQQLAREVGVDVSQYMMPPDTLEALCDSLFANCEKRVAPTEGYTLKYWRALARYVGCHVVNPRLPPRNAYTNILSDDEYASVLEHAWTGFDCQTDKQLFDWAAHEAQHMGDTLDGSKSAGWDKLVYGSVNKQALRDDLKAWSEVQILAVSRLLAFAEHGGLVRYMSGEQVFQTGLIDPAMPVLKREPTPLRKLKGRYRRWRSIFVLSATDEIVQKVVQKGHNNRLSVLFNLGADVSAQVGTGSDDRHTEMLKSVLAGSVRDGEVVTSSDVTGMDFCMSFKSYTCMLLSRSSGLQSAGLPDQSVKWALNLIEGAELSRGLQSLLYGNTLLTPTMLGPNSSGCPSTTVNNGEPAAASDQQLDFVQVSRSTGDDKNGVNSFVDDMERKAIENGLTWGFTLRDYKVESATDFESCSKRYLHGHGPVYHFLNLDKGLTRAVLTRNVEPERLQGLMHECRHNAEDVARIRAFYAMAQALGLASPEPLGEPRFSPVSDMP